MGSAISGANTSAAGIPLTAYGAMPTTAGKSSAPFGMPQVACAPPGGSAARGTRTSTKGQSMPDP